MKKILMVAAVLVGASNYAYAEVQPTKQYLGVAYALIDQGGKDCGVSAAQIKQVKANIHKRATAYGVSMATVKAKAEDIRRNGLPAAEIPTTCATVWSLVPGH